MAVRGQEIFGSAAAAVTLPPLPPQEMTTQGFGFFGDPLEYTQNSMATPRQQPTMSDLGRRRQKKIRDQARTAVALTQPRQALGMTPLIFGMPPPPSAGQVRSTRDGQKILTATVPCRAVSCPTLPPPKILPAAATVQCGHRNFYAFEGSPKNPIPSIDISREGRRPPSLTLPLPASTPSPLMFYGQCLFREQRDAP